MLVRQKLKQKRDLLFSYEFKCHILKLYNLYEISVISHGGADGGALNSRCHVLMPIGQFSDENWSMA